MSGRSKTEEMASMSGRSKTEEMASMSVDQRLRKWLVCR